MVRAELTKSQRRRMAELADLAYQRDLDAELAKLDGHFARWRASELSCFDLAALIQAFHQDSARDLANRYDRKFREFAVAGAISRGVLTQAEAGPEILALLGPKLSLSDSL